MKIPKFMESQRLRGHRQRILHGPQIHRMVPDLPPPDGFRYATGKSVTDPLHPVDVVARLAVANPAANAPALPEPTIALRQIDSGQVGLRALLHTAALALPAAALTFALLWWLMHPGKLL